MQKSDDISLLAKALLEAQRKRRNVIKDRDVPDRNGNVKHSHGDLQQVLDKTLPIYNEFGIVVLQPHDDKGIGLMLLHESGQYLYFTSQVEVSIALNRDGMPLENWSQAMGKATTYNRRYSLMGAMGITQIGSTSEDEGEVHEPAIKPENLSLIKALIAERGWQGKVDKWLKEKNKPSLDYLTEGEGASWLHHLKFGK